MRILLSLGSNQGDRAGNLRAAVRALNERDGVRVAAVSRGYATAPMGVVDQPDFLNAAVVVETELTPLELLDAVKEIETRLGRGATYRWGPRVIDIDIVLAEDTVITSDMLTLPHPEFRSRAFVLKPLAEIAPDDIDPLTGKTVAELARAPEAVGRVVKTDIRFL